MRLSRDDIARHIPHAGSMCLLDGVLAHDAEHIVCTASSHRDPANPLRAQGRLGAVCGVEYAAQAMALHGCMLLQADAGSTARPTLGYLASLRSVKLHADRLDDRTEDLRIVAQRLSGEATSVLYAFSVCAGDAVLLEGRAAVVLDASGPLVGQLVGQPAGQSGLPA